MGADTRPPDDNLVALVNDMSSIKPAAMLVTRIDD
jgi:hypothetical protein